MSGQYDKLSERDKGLWDRRDKLVDELRKLHKTNLKWSDVPLAGGLKIQVCSPVYLHRDSTFYYVPVTPAETYELANLFGAFPLTSAVADQAHNQAALQLFRPAMDASMAKDRFDFPRSSDYYKMNYLSHQMATPPEIVSGGHKIWLLSSSGTSVNRGFYVEKAKVGQKPSKNASYLDDLWTTLQHHGTAHAGEDHWDYSQVLQLMTKLTDGQGKALAFTLKEILKATKAEISADAALKTAHAAIWDEPKPPAASQLARLPDA
jgi:hypothetical protein